MDEPVAIPLEGLESAESIEKRNPISRWLAKRKRKRIMEVVDSVVDHGNLPDDTL